LVLLGLADNSPVPLPGAAVAVLGGVAGVMYVYRRKRAGKPVIPDVEEKHGKVA
jgi:hypothetical protein